MFDDDRFFHDPFFDDGELALTIEMRERQADQRRLRAALRPDLGERVRVRARLHLLPADHEATRRAVLDELDDRLAVLRHCHGTVEGSDDAIAEVAQRRAALRARFDDVVIELDVTIGLPPRHGPDWALTDVPRRAVDDVNRAWTALRADLVHAVDHLVASDLVTVGGTSAGFVDLVMREHDADAVARVRAFADEVVGLQRLEQRCTERLRHIALRAAHSEPRSWLAANQLRSRQARDALDLVRAVHAARAELDRVVARALGDRRD